MFVAADNFGHPILADRLYAGQREFHLSELTSDETNAEEDVSLLTRQALHATRLELRHPVTDQPMCWEAPLPRDMQQTLEALQRYRIETR